MTTPVSIVILVIIGIISGGLLRKKEKNPPENNNSNQTTAPVVPPGTTPATTTTTPATPAVPAKPTLSESVKKTFTSKEFRIGVSIGVGVVLLAVTVWFLTSDEVSIKTITPYSFAILLGVFAYYNSDGRRNKNLGYSLWVVAIAVVAIYLWIHPQVFKDVFTPFANSEALQRFFKTGNWGLPALSFAATVYLFWDGKALEGIIAFVVSVFFLLMMFPSP